MTAPRLIPVGGRADFVLSSKRRLMQVRDEVRKCVAFVLYRRNGVDLLAETAFFVGEPLPNTEDGWGCSVTAGHVIDGIRRDRDDQKVYLRLNRRDGTFGILESDTSEWHGHPDGAGVDVAVLPWGAGVEDFDHLTYNMSEFVTDEVIASESIGVGDEVFITGLFAPHVGATRNVPIIRVGNIAAMPEEPIASGLGPIDAYLIEARSIGGLSGSPVFVHLGLHRTTPDGSQFTFGRIPMYMLGLIHGHFDLPPENASLGAGAGFDRERVNTGIGIVVPIAKVFEAIRQPKLEAVRMEREKAATPIGGATMDSGDAPDPEFERVEDLTRKLVNVRKKELDEKREEES